MIEKPGPDGHPLYSLDHPLTQKSVSDLLEHTVDRLLEADSPSLETMKMQVAFDSSYITEEEDFVNYYQRRNARLREMQRTIATMRPKDGADFDALTALHRQVRPNTYCKYYRKIVPRHRRRKILQPIFEFSRYYTVLNLPLQ